jgi:hypothetical protein
MKHSRGIVYGDGTIFLYSFLLGSAGFTRSPSTFRAAILSPGDTVWKTMKKTIYMTGDHRSGAMYQNGNVLVLVDIYMYFWCIFTPDGEDKDTCAEGGMLESCRILRDAENKYFRGRYILESHDELLCVTIFVDANLCHLYASRNPAKAVFVKVYTLEGSNKDDNLRWVPKNGQSLSDHVLFLGSPASFTTDIAHRDANGGCVYFVFHRCVLRYSLVDSKAKLVERLRPGWGSDKAHVWLRQ